MIDKISLSLCRITKKVQKKAELLFIVPMLFVLGGCQQLDDSIIKVESDTNKVKPTNNKVDFSHYYLRIKSLNDDEIAQEIIKQKNNQQTTYAPSNVQLVMLYSLPNSPIHNPYTAKTMLNDYPLASDNKTIFGDTDLAFIVMLKDQVNQQLLLLEQLTNYKGVYQQAKEVSTAQQFKIDQLNEQIIQLKKIEKTISERGQ